MKNFIILVLMLATAFALPGKEIKSRNLVVPAGQTEGRITKGYDARRGQFPYQVGLSLENAMSSHFWCGGSLLNHEWILTAAHCTYGIVKVRVLLGYVDRGFARYQYQVSKENFVIHADYDPSSLINDISLIKIPYTKYTTNIQPVKLPAMSRSYSDYIGEGVIASGWGRIGDASSDTTNVLQWVHLNILPNRICGRNFWIHSSNICTATINSANICNGDSGGPIVLEHSKVQIGLTSFGDNSCLKNIPSVFTRVTSYLDWIKAYTGVPN